MPVIAMDIVEEKCCMKDFVCLFQLQYAVTVESQRGFGVP